MVVSDAPLRRLLESEALIRSTWPHVNGDVLVLVELLQVTEPSLAEVLETGLVGLGAASPRNSVVTLVHEGASVLAVSQDDDGGRVAKPMTNPEKVVCLDIVDVQAEGRSGAEVAT